MKQPKIIVAGIGPGSEQDITPAVLNAVREADVVVGYKYYFRFIQPYLNPETECIDTGMKREALVRNRHLNWQNREKRFVSSVPVTRGFME